MNVATTNSKKAGKAKRVSPEKSISKEKPAQGRRPELPEKAMSAARVWLVLAKAHGAMAEFVEKSVQDQHLCLSDFMVLEALLHKGPLSISALGNKVLLKNASMTSAVDRLEKRGFVVRRSIELDRRVRVVELTFLGADFAKELYMRHEAQLEELMADIPQTERKRLHDGLKALGLTAEKATRPPTEKRYPWR